jgi:triosephosphate isomerase
MDRRSLIVGNWKMALSHKAAIEASATLKKLIKTETEGLDLVICPSFPSLAAVADTLKNSQKIQLGAQNVHWEEQGAWTGEVSVLQIKPFVSWCIIGHSERRGNFNETDETVVQKMNLLLKHSITPIICGGYFPSSR